MKTLDKVGSVLLVAAVALIASVVAIAVAVFVCGLWKD